MRHPQREPSDQRWLVFYKKVLINQPKLMTKPLIYAKLNSVGHSPTGVCTWY